MIILNLILVAAELLVLTACLYYFMSHNSRTVYPRQWITFVCFAAYGAVLLADTYLVRSQLLRTVIGIGLVLFIGTVCFHRKIQTLFWDVLYQVIIYLCQISSILMVQTILVWRGQKDIVLLGNLSMMLKILLIILSTWLLTRAISGKKKPLKKKQILRMFLLPVISLLLMVSFIEVGSLYFKLYGIGLLAFDMILLILLNIYFIYLLGYLFRADNLEKDLQMYQMQNRLQLEHYEELEQKYEDSRRVIHDMKNHLQAITGLYKRQAVGEGEAYVRDMFRMLDTLGQHYYTDHKLLNIIMNEKIGKARQKGIRAELMIGSAELGKLRDIDITTIFTNILDNAIEASEECPDPYVSLKMDRINDFLVIKMENSSQGTEKKAGHMGVGLENVRSTLQSYHGSLQTQQQGQTFLTTVIIPV